MKFSVYTYFFMRNAMMKSNFRKKITKFYRENFFYGGKFEKKKQTNKNNTYNSRMFLKKQMFAN